MWLGTCLINCSKDDVRKKTPSPSTDYGRGQRWISQAPSARADQLFYKYHAARRLETINETLAVRNSPSDASANSCSCQPRRAAGVQRHLVLNSVCHTGNVQLDPNMDSESVREKTLRSRGFGAGLLRSQYVKASRAGFRAFLSGFHSTDKSAWAWCRRKSSSSRLRMRMRRHGVRKAGTGTKRWDLSLNGVLLILAVRGDTGWLEASFRWAESTSTLFLPFSPDSGPFHFVDSDSSVCDSRGASL